MTDYRYFFEKNYDLIRNVAVSILQANTENSQNLNNFNSHHFEWFCNYFLFLKGYQVLDMSIAKEHHPDGGIDGILKKDRGFILMQAKKHNSFESTSGRLSVKVLREFSGVLSRDALKYKNNLRGVIMTSGVFTRSFLSESPNFKNIDLYDLHRFKTDPTLSFIANSQKPTFKYSLFSKLKINSILLIQKIFGYLKKSLVFLGFLSTPVDYARDKVGDITESAAKYAAYIFAGFFSSLILNYLLFLVYTKYLKSYFLAIFDEGIFDESVIDDYSSYLDNEINLTNNFSLFGLSNWQFVSIAFSIFAFFYFLSKFKTRSKKKFNKAFFNLIGVFSAIILILFLDSLGFLGFLSF